jgi:hypothetical protein
MGLEKMRDDVVNYTGVGWPSASLVDVSYIDPKMRAPTPGLDLGPGPWRSFVITIGDAPGEGWRTDRPHGVWRSVGELVLPGNEGGFGESVLGLVKRYGAIDNRSPGPDGRFETGPWLDLMCYLRDIAEAWDPPDRDGVSHLTLEAWRLDRAKHWLVSFLLPAALADSHLVTHAGPVIVPRRFNSHADGLDLQPQARSLRTYLVLSANSMFKRRAPMRTCNHCSVWFAPARVDQRFCSPYCRGAAHRTERGQ